jgi:F-type H+-transporting ATPase subunit delta
VKPLALARRYARALADAAGGTDGSRLEKTAAELQLLAEVFGLAPRALRFLDDPSIPADQKEKAMARLALAAKLGDLSRRFLQVLIDHRRVGAIPEISRAFTELKDGRLGIVPVETTTAVPLSAAEVKRLEGSLEKMTGRAVRLTTRVDPALVGGARTRIGSRVYDGTLKRRLALLRAQLAVAR